MKRPVAALVAASLLAAAVTAAAILARPLLAPELADWLSVKAPSIAERGRPFTIEVRLENPEPGLFLRADLHGQDSSREDLGYVSGASALRVEEGRLDYSFDLRVPARPDLAYVNGLVYASEGGGWGSMIAAARLDPVRVEEPGPASEKRPPRPVKAFPMPSGPSSAAGDSFPLQVAVSAAWALCAALSWIRSRRKESILFALGCLVASFSDLFLPGSGWTNVLRDIAKDWGLYIYRKAPQQALSLAALALGIVATALIISLSLRTRRFMRGGAWLGLCGYWGILFLRFVSQHDIDALLSKSLAGIPVGQAGRSACAALALAVSAVELGRRNARGER